MFKFCPSDTPGVQHSLEKELLVWDYGLGFYQAVKYLHDGEIKEACAIIAMHLILRVL